jgi:hypothetical protein
MNTYGIVRLDRMSGTVDGRLKAKVAIENGMFVVQDEVNGELILPTAVTDKVKLVASVCHQYESMNEGDFINEADSNLHPRTYDPEMGNIFTITENVIGYTDESTTISARTKYADIIKGDLGFVSVVEADYG